RHKLWLQCCFNELGGLGQEEELTLEDPEEHERVDGFIENLRECKDSVTDTFFCLAVRGRSCSSHITASQVRKVPSFIMDTKLSTASCKSHNSSRLRPSKKSSVGMSESNSHRIGPGLLAACFFLDMGSSLISCNSA